MLLRMWLIWLLAILLLLVAAPVSYQESNDPGPGVIRTQHFTVTYDAKTLRTIARYNAEGIEATYRYFVIQRGFRYDQIPRDRKLSFDTNMAPLTAECVRSLHAHEFFHSIQQGGYNLPTYDKLLIEGTAVWAQYEVFLHLIYTDKWCQQFGLLHLLLGGTDVNLKKYIIPGYGGWLFWRYVADRYGGAELIRRLFEAIKTEGWPAWRRELGKLVGKSFLELWTDFALALATRDLRDAQWLYSRAEERTPHVPVPVFVGEWEREALSIEQSNWENPYPQICTIRTLGEEESGRLLIETCPAATEIINAGDPLRVRQPYGIHFLRITPKADAPLLLRFAGDAQAEFRVWGVGLTRSGDYKSFPIAQTCVISKPLLYQLLQIVVTRGESGSGEYKMSLEAPQEESFPCTER